MQGVFYGVGAAVIAIIGRSAYKLLKSTLGRDRLLWAIFATLALSVAITEREILVLFVGAGLLYMFVQSPPSWRKPAGTALSLTPGWWLAGIHGVAAPGLVTKLFTYFAAAGAFVFGSGLAIVPFLHGGVVAEFGWLTERQFLDAVAVAMITPGPVVITVAFIGFLVAGPVGAVAAAAGVFLPCYLFVIVPAKYFRRATKNASVNAFVTGVTAAATGAIGGSVYVLGRRSIIDLPTMAIAAATLLVLVYAKRIPEPVLVLAAALAGLLFH
jgi:chromate transporter